MAMYYQGGSEIQADGLQTLYLMNPNYIGYADTHHHHHQQQQQQSASMFFLNSVPGGNLPHVSVPAQAHAQGHLVGVPLPAGFQDPNRPSIEEISTSHHGLLSHFWSSADHNSSGGGGGGGNGSQSRILSSTVVSPTSGTGGGTTTDFASQLGFQRPGLVSPTQAHHQGLSLSLSPQQQQQQQRQQMNFRSFPLDHHEISTTNHQVGILSPSPSPRTNTSNIDHTRGSGVSSSFSLSNGMILGSKYLKVAQNLLDEVVNVGQNIKLSDGLEDVAKEKHKLDTNELISLASDDVESSSQKNSVVELTTAQRQELQMKKAKLVSMLDEVDQRYRQYHHQMKMIASSFEQAAGLGSSKSYTQLALHTISKQFRCLKDAISGQIKDTTKTLGEEENIGRKIEGSKLKFVDHHLRQQRALQQLGMMQTNAWRPQRGLPERAVSVLRAWLFEHFLHPYPKDSDKIMLAKQTGLTRSQVSNWFINARVRLWKPMVEEMYMEEVKKNNQEQNGLDQENIVNKNIEPNNEVVGSKSSAPQEKLPISSNIHDASPTEISTSTISTSPTGGGGGGGWLPAQAAAGFSFIGSLNMENIADQRNNKKPRNDMQNSSTSTLLSVDTEINKVGQDTTIKSEKLNRNNHRQTRECYPLMTPYTMDDQFGTRFNPNHQQLATTSTFHQGNGHVSLTLGLPPNSENQHNFLPNNQDIGLGSHYNRMSNPQASHHPNISYENIDFQSGKRYAAQLLQDFVS